MMGNGQNNGQKQKKNWLEQTIQYATILDTI